MTQEISLSQLGPDREAFERAVAEHVQKLKAFSTEVGKPRPVAHPLVEMSVKRISYPRSSKRPDEYEADYVIVDDTPPPPPPLNLADRKSILFNQLRAAENAAKEKLVPNLKRRLFIMQFQAAMTKEEGVRTREDQDIINDYISKQNAMTAIELRAAEAEATLEDVTEDNIDSWQIPDFG